MEKAHTLGGMQHTQTYKSINNNLLYCYKWITNTHVNIPGYYYKCTIIDKCIVTVMLFYSVASIAELFIIGPRLNTYGASSVTIVSICIFESEVGLR